ncbi:cupin domain-containing protein [Thermococcus sp.]
MVEVYNFNGKWNECLGHAIKVLEIEDRIQVGILTMPPHSKLPEEGVSIHKNHHEFAYIIEGEVVLITDKGEFQIKTGEFSYNEPNTPHYTLNKTNKPAKILWMLVKI